MRKFKRKRRISTKKVVLIVLLIPLFLIGKRVMKNVKLLSSNEEFLNHLLKDSTHYKLYQEDITDFDRFILKVINIKKPVSLLENFLGIKKKEKTKVEEMKERIMQVSKIDSYDDEPIVYIYNSHPGENYDSTNYELYNINPNVQMASYILKEELKRRGISSIVEEESVTNYLNVNHLSYDYSYDASRHFMEQALLDYPTLRYFIDIHRDSIGKFYSTCEINGTSYARYLFIVGKEHPNYQYNLELANRLKDKTDQKEACLTRGVMEKGGYGVNGIYNQDFDRNVLLIEVGGQENSIDEVMNTMEFLADILKEEINGR